MKNRIRELRQARGIKQADLAKYLGVAHNTLSYWEQGKYDVDNTSLQKIADFFKCTVDYVLFRDEPPLSLPTDIFTEKEISIIRAYRARPEMQPAIDKLLGIESALGKNIGQDISETVSQVPKAIHTKYNSNSK